MATVPWWAMLLYQSVGVIFIILSGVTLYQKKVHAQNSEESPTNAGNADLWLIFVLGILLLAGPLYFDKLVSLFS